jgi:hypothetical protein
MPAGGLSPDHQRWIHPKYADFFLPVKVLTRVFRGKFVEALRRAYDRNELDLAGATEPLRDPAQWHAFVDARGRMLVEGLGEILPRYPRDSKITQYSAGLKRFVRCETKAPWKWQDGVFDRLLRRDESAESKWIYMRENPVRAGLVRRWEDWPYAIGYHV